MPRDGEAKLKREEDFLRTKYMTVHQTEPVVSSVTYLTFLLREDNGRPKKTMFVIRRPRNLHRDCYCEWNILDGTVLSALAIKVDSISEMPLWTNRQEDRSLFLPEVESFHVRWSNLWNITVELPKASLKLNLLSQHSIQKSWNCVHHSSFQCVSAERRILPRATGDKKVISVGKFSFSPGRLF